MTYLEEDTGKFTEGESVDVFGKFIVLVHLLDFPTDRDNVPIIVHGLPVCQNQNPSK
jgi:hypothetical protein